MLISLITCIERPRRVSNGVECYWLVLAAILSVATSHLVSTTMLSQLPLVGSVTKEWLG